MHTLTHADLKAVLAIGHDLAHLEDALAIVLRTCDRCPALPGVADLQATLTGFRTRLESVNLIDRLLFPGPIDRNKAGSEDSIDLSAEQSLEPLANAQIPASISPAPEPVADVPLASALLAAAEAVAAREDAQEGRQDVAAVEPSSTSERASETQDTPSSHAAARSSRETAEQTMARVLLPSHEPTTAAAKKRNRRGKAGQVDAGSGAAD